MLRRLAVFAGSFGLDTAQQVAADAGLDEWAVLDALAALVDHSLVQVQTERGLAAADMSAPRYRLAETTRLYATEQLKAAHEAEATTLRHRLALAQAADQADHAFWVLTQAHWLARFGANQDDMQFAFDAACASGDAGVAARTGQALAALDAARGQGAGVRARGTAARALLAHTTDTRTVALLWNLVAPAWSLELPVHTDGNDRLARVAAWRSAGDAAQHCLALRDLALACARDGHGDDAAAAAAQMWALEDPGWSPGLHIELDQFHADLHQAGPTEAGHGGLLHALGLAEQMGDAHRLAWLRFRLAESATAVGPPETAVGLGEVAVRALEALRRPIVLGCAWSNLSAAHLFRGDDAAARQAAAEAHALLRSHPCGAALFHHLALLAVRAGDAEVCARLLGHADHSNHGAAQPQRAAIVHRLRSLALVAVATASGPGAGGADLDEAQADALARSILGGSDG